MDKSCIPSTWTWYVQYNRLHILCDNTDLVVAQSIVRHTVDCTTTLSLQRISHKYLLVYTQESKNKSSMTHKNITDLLKVTSSRILLTFK